jgi:SNF2 family DNA or RNA helicase
MDYRSLVGDIMTTIPLSDYPKGLHVHVQTVAWLAASKGFTGCDFTGVVIGGTEKALLIKQDNERAQGWLPFSQTTFTRELGTQVVFTPGQEFPDIPNITTTAWAHQKQAYWFAYDKPAAYYALEMGCGKSLPTVALVINRNHFLSLILCPKSVVDVWADPEDGEFARWSAKPIDVLALRKGSVTQRVAQASLAVNRARNIGRPLVLVMNYEAAWCSPMGPTYEYYTDKNGHERSKITEPGFLMGTGLDCVIADECHRLKSASGKASHFASQLGDRVPYRLALSGTPMPHNPNDLYAQYRFLDKSIFGANFSLFKERYAQYGGFGNTQYLRPRNEEELNQKFYSIAFRVTKDILDLPPFTHQTRHCELPQKARRVYDELEKDFYAQVDAGEITAKNALTVLTRIHQLTGGTLTLDTDDPKVKKYSLIDSGKQDLLADVLDDIAADEQVVIFGTFHGDLDTIKSACAAAGRTCAELSGRRNELKQFQDGQKNCIAVQIDSGGAGIDLTKARYCIYYSVGYSLGNYDQSLNRVHRPRQTRHTYFIHLLCKGTIDEIIYKALDKKRRIVEFVMNLHLGKPVYDDAPGQETLL